MAVEGEVLLPDPYRPRRACLLMCTLSPGRVPTTTSASRERRWSATRASDSLLYCRYLLSPRGNTVAGRA